MDFEWLNNLSDVAVNASDAYTKVKMNESKVRGAGNQPAVSPQPVYVPAPSAPVQPSFLEQNFKELAAIVLLTGAIVVLRRK